MVNGLQQIKGRIVKAKAAPAPERRISSFAGLALVQAMANRMGFVSDSRRLLPARKDTTQGFETSAVALCLIHGLLSGGQGFSATEPMREDISLLEMLGLKRAPSAETVEGVIKFMALERDGRSGANALLRRQAGRCIDKSNQKSMRSCHGFVPVWADGTLLEVTGKRFDSIKIKDSQRGQMGVGAFVGPWLTGMDFALKGQGEETVARSMIDGMVEDVLGPRGLMDKALILLDSLYGDGPTLDQLEAYEPSPHYIVGVQKLSEAARLMSESVECVWRDTGAQARYHWRRSGVATMWLQCATWPEKRQMICRRWMKEGEMIWNYAAVVTSLTPSDTRVRKIMKAHQLSFEEAIWRLYGYKQAMENQWKDLLCDMSLHHPPCAKAAVNAVFYALAGAAYNLSVAVRRFALSGKSKRMRLWRLRREVLALAGHAVHHARTVTIRLVDARERLVEQLLTAMGRVARC